MNEEIILSTKKSEKLKNPLQATSLAAQKSTTAQEVDVAAEQLVHNAYCTLAAFFYVTALQLHLVSMESLAALLRFQSYCCPGVSYHYKDYYLF